MLGAFRSFGGWQLQPSLKGSLVPCVSWFLKCWQLQPGLHMPVANLFVVRI